MTEEEESGRTDGLSSRKNLFHTCVLKAKRLREGSIKEDRLYVCVHVCACVCVSHHRLCDEQQ